MASSPIPVGMITIHIPKWITMIVPNESTSPLQNGLFVFLGNHSQWQERDPQISKLCVDSHNKSGRFDKCIPKGVEGNDYIWGGHP